LVASADDGLLDARERGALLGIARQSIACGLERGAHLEIDPASHPARLRVERGCFVTLQLEGELRGCVGSLRPRGSLVCEVARIAFSAAFRDPRFAPVRAAEEPLLDVHISILSEPTPVSCTCEDELVEQLRPGVDGVILTEGDCRGTFLPEVWERFPDPRQFLAQLRQKAGLPRGHWSSSLRVERYTTEAFS
jgi:AmmeMemoRadiSam system protein A